jgi:pimeloyl-ACP methyl ester carboxylesterase
MTKITSTLVALAVVCAPAVSNAQQTEENEQGLPYLFCLPAGHTPSESWPVMVFLHGYGENSDDTGGNLQAVKANGPPALCESWGRPFIVISPQVGDAGSPGFVGAADQISAILDKVEAEYGGDPAREYLTGLSYGGHGSLELVIKLAPRFAAIASIDGGCLGLPCSVEKLHTGGSEDTLWADRSDIFETATMFMHGGAQDENSNPYTPLAVIQERVDVLEAESGHEYFRYDSSGELPADLATHKYAFVTYLGQGHGAWGAAYSTDTFYDWMLAQSRAGSSGAGGAGGTGGSNSGGTGGSTAQAGAGGSLVSAGGTSSDPGVGGTTTAGSGGSSVTSAGGGTSRKSTDAGGCAIAGPAHRSRSSSVLVFALMALACSRLRLSRRRR